MNFSYSNFLFVILFPCQTFLFVFGSDSGFSPILNKFIQHENKNESLDSKLRLRQNPAQSKYQVYLAWKKVEYKFGSRAERAEMIKSGKFIQKNCAITGAKPYRNRVFLTTPRYKEGIPFTLNVVSYSSSPDLGNLQTKSPKLKPFPSPEMNQEGNCKAFQLVQGMEIDQYGRLWLVDVGRTVLLTTPKNLCPAKIVVIDLKNGDKIISSYEFPKDVVAPTGNALKDTSVACTSREDCFVYIADIFASSVTVFDYKNKKSWAVRHKSMEPKPDKANFTIAGVFSPSPFGVAGSALSPRSRNFDTLYYSPVADTKIYAVKTADLKRRQRNFNLTDDQVRVVLNRRGQSDGWAMTSKGKLYFGSLPQNAVYSVQTTRGSDSNQKLGAPKLVAKSDKNFQWQDTFGFDNNGWILLTTNRFQFYDDAKYNFDQVNFRLIRFPTKDKAYLFK